MKKELIQWLLGEETGLSSKHIVGHMLNLEVYHYHPCDIGDRKRCIGLLRAMPEWIKRLDEMKQYSGWGEQVELIKKALNNILDEIKI